MSSALKGSFRIWPQFGDLLAIGAVPDWFVRKLVPGLRGSGDGRLCLASSCLPFGVSGLVVVDDDVGELGWADCFEVELLGWHVAVAVALLRLVGGHERGLVSDPGAFHCALESGGHEYAQVP